MRVVGANIESGGRQADLIAIRIDTDQAVQDFFALLAEQAAQGETRAPANPANRAVFRQLAPFRLVEFSYINPAIGPIDDIYMVFPDQTVYSVVEEIPEQQVDWLVQAQTIAPVYIYVLLSSAVDVVELDRFMMVLAQHVDESVVGVFADPAIIRLYHAESDAHPPQDDHPSCLAARQDSNSRLTRQQLKSRYKQRFHGVDGQGWASIQYQFQPVVLEFPDHDKRDDFIAWTKALHDKMSAGWCRSEDLGMDSVLRPARIAPCPLGEVQAFPVVNPAEFQNGRPWQVFEQSPVCDTATSAILAEYWHSIRQSVDQSKNP